jgi:hypothetical protein
LRLRLESVFNRSRVERDLEDELRDYLDREQATSLYELERIKEECRDARGVRWLDDTLSDTRFAVRSLRKAPVFTATVIAALAFCIGLNRLSSLSIPCSSGRCSFSDQDHLVAVTEAFRAWDSRFYPFHPGLSVCCRE